MWCGDMWTGWQRQPLRVWGTNSGKTGGEGTMSVFAAHQSAQTRHRHQWVWQHILTGAKVKPPTFRTWHSVVASSASAHLTRSGGQGVQEGEHSRGPTQEPKVKEGSQARGTQGCSSPGAREPLELHPVGGSWKAWRRWGEGSGGTVESASGGSRLEGEGPGHPETGHWY